MGVCFYKHREAGLKGFEGFFLGGGVGGTDIFE